MEDFSSCSYQDLAISNHSRVVVKKNILDWIWTSDLQWFRTSSIPELTQVNASYIIKRLLTLPWWRWFPISNTLINHSEIRISIVKSKGTYR